MKIGRAALLIINVVAIAIMVWWFASWADVVLHNTYPNPVYQPWNFFVLYF